MKTFYLVAVLIFGLLCISCTPTPQEQLKDSGIFGEHDMNVLSNSQALKGSLAGGFFFGCGSVEGQVTSDYNIRFSWSPEQNVILITSIPESKIRIQLDSTKVVPTVEFKFDENWLNPSWDSGQRLFGRIISQKEKENLNELITAGNYQYAIIRISRETLERESCLPH